MTYYFQGRRFDDSGALECAYKTAPIPASMPRHQGWATDSIGRPYITFDNPASGDYVGDGMRFTSDGALYVTTEDPASGDVVSRGMRRDSIGRVYVDPGATASTDSVGAGRRVDSLGRLLIAGTAMQQYASSLTPAAWFQFNTGITVTGSGVSQWSDQSGNGRHLTQGTDTNRPSLQADGSIKFDGNDNYLTTSAFSISQPYTFYLLWQQVSWAAAERILDGNIGSANTPSLRQATAGVSPEVLLNAGADVGPISTATIGTYNALVAVCNGASSVLATGYNAGATGNAGASALSGITMGASATPGAYSDIIVKEYILYGAAHDATTRRRIISYLSQVGSLAL